MSEEKKEIESPEEDEKIESEEETEKESDESEEKKSEGEESQKDDFEKDSETVPAGKYNQAIRKLREKELEERELRKQLAEKPAKKEEKKEEDDEDEDFFADDDEKSKKDLDIDSIVEKKVKPILERLTKQEQDDKRKQRDAFFKAHPKYLNDSKEWQSLLDEMDESINPNKGTYYEQLTKAHRILSGSTSSNRDVEAKKNEMAVEMGASDKGSKKSDTKSSVDERADRLAKQMPIGYTYTGK
jgi:hypothetical protein